MEIGQSKWNCFLFFQLISLLIKEKYEYYDIWEAETSESVNAI